MEAIGFFQCQVDPCVWYRKDMVPMLYVGGCLIFSPSKDKIGGVYASI